MIVNADLSELRFLAERYRNIAPFIFKRLQEEVTRTAMDAQANVRQSSPVFIGTLANSIHVEAPIVHPQSTSISISGSVFTSEPHGVVVEEGREPGKKYPPIRAIRRWVHLKSERGQFTLPQKDSKGRRRLKRQRVDSAAFIVARKIAKEGTKARKIFENELQRSSRLLASRVEELVSEVKVRMEGA